MAQVESLIARCLLDADFLRDAGADPVKAAADRNLSPDASAYLEALDVARVRQFAGFITKVQHNHLWESTPYTRALLKHYGAEIETFATYHGRHLQLRADRASRTEKDDAFFAFLDEYAAARKELRGLRDILRHERILLELEGLRQGLAEMPTVVPRTPFATRVPVVRGALRVACFDCHPLEIAATVNRGALASNGVAHWHVTLVYSAQSPTRDLVVLEVDDLTAAVLAAVDGERTIRAVTEHVAGRTATDALVSRLRPVFDAATNAGLLNFAPGGEAACG
jgi:hypothetical protein